MPKASVILPTYNRAPFIGRAIQSVLNQTYKDFELIIVDDGSIDDTEKVVKSFSDGRIYYVKHEINKGAAAARNTALRLAKGEFIAFQDSDDECLPEKLEKQINKFNKVQNSVGVVYCGHSTISERTNRAIFQSVPVEKGNVYNIMLWRCITTTTALLIKRVCFEKVGLFDETLPSCQDWDMLIRISKYYEFDFIPDILAKIYVHGDQISTNLDTRIKGNEKMLEKYKVELSEDSSYLSRFLIGLFLRNCMAGKAKQGRKHLINALKLKPVQVKGYIHLSLSVLIPWIYRKILKSYYMKNIDGIMGF